MSCNQSSSNVSRLCGVKAGINRLSSQAGSLAGQLTRAATGTLGQSATKALTLAHSVEGPKTLDALTPLAAIGALASGDGRTRLRILNAITAAQVGRAVAGGLGSSLARLSKPAEETVRSNVYFKGRPLIRSWPSRLTPLLNARDIAGWPRRSVVFSGGQMLESEGQTWHAGTTVVERPRGETRTITHVQKMGLPGQHYYFNRVLPEREVAGLICGQKGFSAKDIKGFAGQISELESLQPLAVRMKQGLIQAHLLWGEKRGLG